MDLKNPFALFENRIITIYDLDESKRGLKCNCICPNCKAPFEAKMGDVRQWHFAHSGTPCDSVKLYVNACYLLIRQILLDNGKFQYPSLNIQDNKLFESGIIKINNVEIVYNREELAIGLIINDKDLALRLLLDIEYCVEDVKSSLDGLSALLIDFRNIQMETTGVITNRLCNELFGKTWIYSIAQKRYKCSIKKDNRRKKVDVNEPNYKFYDSHTEYRQPIVSCKLCGKTVHKDDAMWARNNHGYICHKCIEANNLDWRKI